MVDSRSVDCHDVNCVWTLCKGMGLSVEADGLISSEVHNVLGFSGGQSAQGQGSPPGSLLTHGLK